MMIREHAEAIRDAHFIDGRSNGLCTCEQKYPCFERKHAQAIINALDASDVVAHSRGEPHRLVPDCTVHGDALADDA